MRGPPGIDEGRPARRPPNGQTSAGTAARINARLAVELDPVRRADRLADLRLAAAIALSPRVEAAECLLFGVNVPARRLDPRWVRVLGLVGGVELTDELALRVVAAGALPATTNGKALGRAA